MNSTKNRAPETVIVMALVAGCAQNQISRKQEVLDKVAKEVSACVSKLNTVPAINSIRSKIYIGSTGSQPFSYLTNSDKPTSEEKMAISAYADGWSKCHDHLVDGVTTAGAARPYVVVASSSKTTFLNALAALHNGQISYGDFAKFRKEISDNLEIAISKIDRELGRDALAAQEAASQAVMANAAMTNAWANTTAANALMMQATKPTQRQSLNCRSYSIGGTISTNCN